jgi:hypothetical protein
VESQSPTELLHSVIRLREEVAELQKTEDEKEGKKRRKTAESAKQRELEDDVMRLLAQVAELETQLSAANLLVKEQRSEVLRMRKQGSRAKGGPTITTPHSHTSSTPSKGQLIESTSISVENRNGVISSVSVACIIYTEDMPR